jgi:streptomycin 6-kinase
VNISDRLRATVDRSGSDARAWVERLPALLRATTAAWGLDLRQQLTHDGHASVTFHVLTGAGEPAVLKLSLPDEETRFEGPALVRWAGDGAVRLLRASDDGYTLLLERCAPGHDLWTVDTVEQIEVIVDLLPHLWRQPQEGDPFPEVSDTVAGWVARMPELARSIDVPDEVAADVRSWARELKGDGPRRLLHGDLHPSNILAAERAPWLAIDPKPMAGEPEFTMLLLGLGLRCFSITPPAIPEIKRILRSVNIEQCQKVARRVSAFDSDREVLNYLRDELGKVVPEAIGGRSVGY